MNLIQTLLMSQQMMNLRADKISMQYRYYQKTTFKAKNNELSLGKSNGKALREKGAMSISALCGSVRPIQRIALNKYNTSTGFRASTFHTNDVEGIEII